MIIERVRCTKAWMITKSFSMWELKCPCGVCQLQVIDLDLPFMLQKLRDIAKRPVIITPRGGAFRCEKWNKTVGGLPNSQHLLGKAADIEIHGVTGPELYAMACLAGFTSIGVGAKFIHVDTRPDTHLWFYDSMGSNDLIV
jgi:uncharacterized protein YcbK (DUF882 family)